MKFGLVCEGVTDQITLENILCGYFEDEDLDGEIGQLQPPFDETDRKQVESVSGGWYALFKYLETARFRDDVLNNTFVVLQIDTDVSEIQGFEVRHRDDENNVLEPVTLIDKVIEKLIATIDGGGAGFYQEYADKLLFCICVHSLECWIYAHYNQEMLKKPKITGCENALKYYLDKKDICRQRDFKKDYRCYDKLTQPFLQRENIDAAAKKDPSLQVFTETLKAIENKL